MKWLRTDQDVEDKFYMVEIGGKHTGALTDAEVSQV